MAEEIAIGGKTYISSRRASQQSSYAQDYIGQLARSGQIDAHRVGTLWYVSMDSLLSHKNRPEEKRPEAARQARSESPEVLVSFDGSDHLSAARAAEITGYHPDYVSQLAREGTVPARQVGNRWYVEQHAILSHKKEKDSLLAAVQAESVGLHKASGVSKELGIASDVDDRPFFTYTMDEADLMPFQVSDDTVAVDGTAAESALAKQPRDSREYVIPIRTTQSPLHHRQAAVRHAAPYPPQRAGIGGNALKQGVLLVGALATVVIFLGVGFTSLRHSSLYAGQKTLQNGVHGLTASAADAFRALGDLLEGVVVPGVEYRRQD